MAEPQYRLEGTQESIPLFEDVLKLFEECSIIFSTVKTSNMDELETVTPIVVMK